MDTINAQIMENGVRWMADVVSVLVVPLVLVLLYEVVLLLAAILATGHRP